MKEYFPHDANARSDERLLELRAERGLAGYGLWWLVVEHLREATGYRLSNTKLGGLAMGVSVSPSEMRGFIDYCVSLGLLCLEEEGTYFYAPALRRRMKPLDDKRQALSESGKRGASKRWGADSQDEAKPEPAQRTPNSQAIATPLGTPIASKVKESRVEESKEPSSSLRSDEGSSPEPAPAQEKKIEPEPSPAEDELLPEDSDAQASRTGGAAEKPRLQFMAFAQSPYATETGLAAVATELKLADVNVGYYMSKIGHKAGSEDNRTLEAWHTYAVRFLTNDAKHGQLVTNTIPLDPQRNAILQGNRQPARSGAAARLQVTPPTDAKYGYNTPTSRTAGPFGGN